MGPRVLPLQIAGAQIAISQCINARGSLLICKVIKLIDAKNQSNSIMLLYEINMKKYDARGSLMICKFINIIHIKNQSNSIMLLYQTEMKRYHARGSLMICKVINIIHTNKGEFLSKMRSNLVAPRGDGKLCCPLGRVPAVGRAKMAIAKPSM